MRGHERSGGLAELGFGAVSVEHPYTRKDRLVEPPPHLVGRARVQLARIGEELKPAADVVGSRREIVVDVRQLGLDLFAVRLDLADAVARHRRGHAAIGDQIEQVVRLDLQSVQLIAKLLSEDALRPRLIFQGGIDRLLDRFDELRTEPDRPVMVGYCLLHELHAEVPRLAAALLSRTAEEVEVVLAVLTDAALDDHPAVVHAALGAALAAPEGSFQVVGMNTLPLSGAARHPQHLLHVLEHGSVDNGGVSALVRLALVNDVADVIAVAQHARHLRRRDRSRRAVRRRPGGQPPLGQDVGDLFHGVLAGRVEIEGESHEGSALVIDRDRSDLTSLDAVDRVQVANWGAPDRASVLRFVGHLVRDVCPVLARAVLVEGRQDAVHQLAYRSGVDRFRRGDQLDVSLPEVRHDDGVIYAVPGKARQLIHHDVVDVAVAADSLEHLLERDALRHLGRGLTGLDVLGDNRQAELVGLALAGDALRGDRDPFRVVVGVDLSLRRHAQIEHRPRAGRHVNAGEGVLQPR